MKILLTGKQHIGKTYAITKFLEKFGSNFSYGGYRTFSLAPNKEYIEDINKNIYMNVASKYLTPCFDDKYIFATRPQKVANKIFLDNFAKNDLKKDIQNKNLIILDEIGYMESVSTEFTNLVKQILLSNVNVLGVIRNKNNDYLDSIRKINGIKIIEVFDRINSHTIDEFYEMLKM